MMLLTAFVLVIGFVALTGMVARVAQLPEETRQSTDRPIFTESKAVANGIQEMLERTNDLTAVDEDSMATYPAAYRQHVLDATRHMEQLESARGFRLNFMEDPVQGVVVCDDSSGSTVFSTTFSMNDIETRIVFTASYALKDAADGADMDSDPTPYTSCL